MKLLVVNAARSVWIFDLNLLNPQGLSLQGVLEKLTERYKFAKTPKNVLDVNEQKALSFQHGTFRSPKGAAINVTLSVFNDGLIGETQSSTDDSTEFLRDVTNWLAGDFQFVIPPEEQIKKSYVSQIDVEMNVPLLGLNPKLQRLVDMLQARVKPADGKQRRWDVAGLSCWTEDVTTGFAPVNFRLERRWGKPFDSNQYFSQSPLQTQEHTALLQEFEQLLTA